MTVDGIRAQFQRQFSMDFDVTERWSDDGLHQFIVTTDKPPPGWNDTITVVCSETAPVLLALVMMSKCIEDGQAKILAESKLLNRSH